ncbi:unnamed protein product [Fraxinus pennsylvanica]|uniref:Uncharacterized protein n=1 Tax=Fraxinus pennsylvanica TaxID=56036 RepID=A0AAD2AF89_9LAMI|nr:unnamed protein product [Fraxinus pennsylvanica]
MVIDTLFDSTSLLRLYFSPPSILVMVVGGGVDHSSSSPYLTSKNTDLYILGDFLDLLYIVGCCCIPVAKNDLCGTISVDGPFGSFSMESYSIGDKSILKDAGVHDMKDIEALASPPEVKDSIQTQKYKGDVSYFICTRPGRGPVLLTDEAQALLNAETGLPK